MSALPILCYHQVGSSAEFGRRLNVAPETLSRQVHYFARRGYRFAKASQLTTPFPAKCVCLTFDDAFASAVELGTEVLLRHQAWGTFFAVTAAVGNLSAWEGGDRRPLASWETLRHAQAAGMEIGNHSDTHPHLTRLTYELQLAEIQRAEDALLHHGLSSEAVCYPYGDVDEATVRAAQTVGYRVGLALGRRAARDTDPLLRLPRIVVAYGDGLAGLIYKLTLRPLLPSLRRSRS